MKNKHQKQYSRNEINQEKKRRKKRREQLKLQQYNKTAGCWSFEKDKKEKEIRTKNLDLSIPEQADLRRRMEKCSLKNPCYSLACPPCRTANQTGAVEEMYKNITDIEPLFITVVNPADFISADKIKDFDPEKLLNRMNKQLFQLVKEGVKGYICVEIVYRKDFDCYVPHIHAILVGCSKKRFEKHYKSYRILYKKHCERLNIKLRCVHCEHERPSTERIRILAYLCKFSTQGKAGWISKYGFRPKRSYHNEHMLFLDKWPLSSVFQGIGLRRKKLQF